MPAAPENVAIVRQAAAGLADALHADAATVADLKIAVTEAATNVVLHAYDEFGPLEVEMTHSGGRLGVSVRDRGQGFSPLPGRLDSTPLGFGFALIASLADQFGIQAGAQGTEVQMTFAVDPDLPPVAFPAIRSQLATARPEPNDGICLQIAPGTFAGPVLGRVISMLAARADFSIDRLSDAQLVSDALASHTGAHAVDGRVYLEVEEQRGALEMRIGPLAEGGGDALVQAMKLPGLGSLLEQLADEVEVERNGVEHLRLVLNDAEG
jgi:serine/threonine-protein kinase RsbW